jgi:hypothetical protein
MGATDNILILFRNNGENRSSFGLDGLNSIFRHLDEPGRSLTSLQACRHEPAGCVAKADLQGSAPGLDAPTDRRNGRRSRARRSGRPAQVSSWWRTATTSLSRRPSPRPRTATGRSDQHHLRHLPDGRAAGSRCGPSEKAGRFHALLCLGCSDSFPEHFDGQQQRPLAQLRRPREAKALIEPGRLVVDRMDQDSADPGDG